MLALARAFMQRPRLLLLDEPSLGLAPVLVTEIFRIIRELNEREGLTVLVVEQNAHLALQVARSAYVLEVGRVALAGTSGELREHESDPPELPRLLDERDLTQRQADRRCCSCGRLNRRARGGGRLPRSSARSTSTIFAKQTVAGLAQGAIFGSLALALVLIYRATEVINFAQGEMAMATMYIAYQLIQWGFSYWEAFFATLAISFALGVLIQVVAIRPVQHKSVIAVVIVTSASSSSSTASSRGVGARDIKFMPAPFGKTIYHAGGVSIARQDIGTLLVAIVSVIGLWAALPASRSSGSGMRAAALRPASAALVGVRVDAMLAVGWGLAAMLGAIAGLMTEPSQYVLQPTLMQPILLYAFAAAVLGGLESPAGAVVGGVALGVFLNLLGQYVHFVTSELRLPFAFAVLLGVLLLKPRGLFGRSGCGRYERPRRARAGTLAVAAAALSLLPFTLSGYHRALAAQRRDLLHRRPRAQRPHRLLGPDLDRSRRLHGDRRLHDRDHVARPPHERRS